jgi:hypothetical protein
MKEQSTINITLPILFILLVFTLILFVEAFATRTVIYTSQATSPFSSILLNNSEISPVPMQTPPSTPTVALAVTPTVTPTLTSATTPTPNPFPITPVGSAIGNGLWTQTGSDLTSSQCAFYVSKNISYIYMEVGYWKSDCSIYYLVSAGEIRSAVANAHGAGLKVFAWVTSQVSYGDTLNIGTSSLRQTAFNSMVNLVNVYGFDGVADDAEELEYSVFSDYVAYFNGATLAMHSIGKQYFSAVLTYLATNMGSSLFSQINVDRLQPMLYGYPSNQLPEVFKVHLDFFLRHASSPVGLAIHSDGPFQTLNSSMVWIDQQFARGTPTYNLSGIDLFWFIGMNMTQWNQWSNWTTKK